MRQLNNVTTFLEVARSLSFAAAAKTLGLSTSATSKAVARLEDDLGVKLLHRTTRSVSLTAEGERFLEGASRVTEELEDLVAEISESRGAPRGRLVIGATVVLGRLWLTPLMVEFGRLYPEVTVELRLDDRAADLAAEGLDIVIRAGDLSDNVNLVARRFFDAQVVLCASPRYLEAQGMPASLEDLDRHKCLVFRNPRHGRLYPWRFTFDGYSVSKVMNPAFIANEGAALLAAAEAGAGVVQLPCYMVSDAMTAGRLVPIMRESWPVPQPYHILYLDRRLMSPRIRAVIDFLTAHTPDWQEAMTPHPGRKA